MSIDTASRAALRDAVRRLFTPAPRPGRVGVEIELIAVTAGAQPRPADPAELVAGFDAAFSKLVSFEPGGQLEISLPPRPTVAALVGDIERAVGYATAVAAERGVRLETVGTNPYHSCADVPLWLQTPRYLAMQRQFDRTGPDGRRMMRLTAALQVTIDLLPGRAGHEQWLVANLAGPALCAAFANSPFLDGRPAGTDGARTRIWQGVDLRRTGYDGSHLDPADPIGGYLRFAARAPRLPIPEAADPAYHLSTLFPPVRPRGAYLEVRYLDTQPVERMAEAISTVASLLYDTQARHEALDLLLPYAGELDSAWRASTAAGLTYQDDLLAIAARGLFRLPRGYAPTTIGAMS